MNARLLMARAYRCGWDVDGPDLSGTPASDFPGTRFPYHRERKRLVTLGIDRWIPAPLTSLTESFGFLLTRPPEMGIYGCTVFCEPAPCLATCEGFSEACQPSSHRCCFSREIDAVAAGRAPARIASVLSFKEGARP